MTAPGGRRVVIVGGGFAGLGCAKRLAKHRDVNVTLLDRNNYHQFLPLLYQVATSQLAAGEIAFSLRKLFRNRPNVEARSSSGSRRRRWFAECWSPCTAIPPGEIPI